MKKIISFVINSCMLFWAYFLMWWFSFVILQTPLRAIGIAADSKFEYLWQTIDAYAVMIVVCVGHLLLRDTGKKVRWLSYMEGRSWCIKDAARYVLKSPDFWSNSIGFAIWPVLLPQLFAMIDRLYFSAAFWANCPQSLLTIFTVCLPFVVLSFGAWLVILYRWNSTRLHK